MVTPNNGTFNTSFSEPDLCVFFAEAARAAAEEARTAAERAAAEKTAEEARLAAGKAATLAASILPKARRIVFEGPAVPPPMGGGEPLWDWRKGTVSYGFKPRVPPVPSASLRPGE